MSIAAGCAKRSAEVSSSPGLQDQAGGAGDELAMLEQQLVLREAQLHALGAAPKADRKRDDAAGAPLDHERRNNGPAAKSIGEHEAAPARVAESMPEAAEMAPTAAPAEDAVPPGGRCMQICDIAAAICALEGQICGLASRHSDDPRYQAACERAAGDCRFATEACHACS